MADELKVWLICSECGYNIEVSEKEVMDFDSCAICGGKMVLDMNKGRKIEEPFGDNFPKINLNNEAKKNITQEEIEDFRVDLHTLSPKEIFKRLGE